MFDSITHVVITMDMQKSNNQSFVPITVHFIYNETLHASLLVIEEFHDTCWTQQPLQIIAAKSKKSENGNNF